MEGESHGILYYNFSMENAKFLLIINKNLVDGCCQELILLAGCNNDVLNAARS